MNLLYPINIMSETMEHLRWGRIILSFVVMLYINNTLLNAVSYRQRMFGNDEKHYDILFRIGYVSMRPKKYCLRNIGRDSCLYRRWVFLTLFGGAFYLHESHSAHICSHRVAECVLLPFFALTQLFTVVPDSIPGCLDIVGIPEDSDPTWIFTRIAFHSCGDMLWSSDLVQLMLFIYFAYSMSRDHCRRCKKATQGTIAVLGMLWMLVAIVLIFVARYQYTMDVMISIVVTFFVVKDHGLYNTAVRCFIQKKRYYERQNYAKTSEIDLDAFEV